MTETASLSGKNFIGADMALGAAVLLIPFISWGKVPWLTGPFAFLVAGSFLALLVKARSRASIRVLAAPVRVPLAMALALSLFHLIRSPAPYSSLLFTIHLSVAMIFYYLIWSRKAVCPPVATAMLWTCLLVPWVVFQVLVSGSPSRIGPFLNSNYTATVLLVCLAVLLGALMAKEASGREKIFIPAAAGCTFALMLIGSRSAGLGMILLWTAYMIFGKGRVRFVAIVVILVIVLLPNTIRYRVTEGYKEDPHAFSRLQIWEAALQMGTEHPLVGVGPGLFNEYGPRYAFPTDELPVRYGRIARKPHNEYLRSWAEGGIIGTVILGLFLFLTLRMAVPPLREGRAGPVLAVGVILFQALFHDVTEVFSLMVLMAWGLAQITPETDRAADVRGRAGLFLILAAGVLILISSLWLTTDLVSRSFWLRGQSLIENDVYSARDPVAIAVILNPLLPGAARDLARIELMVGRQPKGGVQSSLAMGAASRANRLNRLDTVPLRIQSALYIKAGREGKLKVSKALALAAGKLEEASLIEPHNALIMLNLSEVMWDLKQHNRALDLIETALEKEPNYLQAHRTRISYLSRLDPDRVAWAEDELAKAQERAAGYKPQSDYEEIILR